MWSAFNRMTEQKARNAAVGRYAAGRGLWLCRLEDGSAHWEMRLFVQGTQRDLQLGAYPMLSVKDAYSEAAKWRGLARRGIDPAAEQEAFRNAAARNLDQFYC